MLDKIDYYNHKLYDPSFYHRQYEKDLPPDPESNSYAETAKRAAHIALPFLSLNQPIGRVISLTMGSVRVFTHTSEVLRGDILKVMQVALAILALAGTLYNFTLGLYITTAADIIANLAQIVEALSRQEYKQVAEELLQLLSSGLYLTIMMTGSLEVVLASILIQALVSFYQAREEYAKGRYPEAIAKSILGIVRLVQAGQQIQQIQRRNDLLKKYRELADRIYKGRKIDHLWDHPLIQAANGKKGVILEDGLGNEYDFGTNLHGYGKQRVKGMNVTMREQDEYVSLDFKVNHVFRDRIQKVITDMSKYSKGETQELLALLGSHVKSINVSEKDNDQGIWGAKNHVIRLEGLGKISIGSNSDVITLYDKISIQLEKGKTLYDFHEALSFLNLDDALRHSADEDIERMKIGQLFRTFKPESATLFERTDAFFSQPLDQFKKTILMKSPEMGAIIKKYLPKMELREIIPGRMRYAINGLSSELTGAYGLTSALTGVWKEQEIKERVASILKMGMISSEMRKDNNIGKQGLSSGTDYWTGGADSVFAQLVTDKTKSYKSFAYQSEVRFLISPKALETGTYQYHDDSFGSRKLYNFWWGDYLQRPNLVDFVESERMFFNMDNEVMIKERLAPEYITGIAVSTESMKSSILDYLRECNIVQMDQFGKETILSKPVDQFIHVGNTIKAEHFT
jgi:hypothetical protein